jgi:hypothetical protein
MRKLSCLVAAAAISGLMLAAGPASASPLAGSLTSGAATVPSFSDDGLVQKVHRWHCRKRYGWFRGHKRWHRHRKACYDYDNSYYDPYYYDPHPYYYRRHYGLGFPFIGFHFGHRRHHHGWWD